MRIANPHYLIIDLEATCSDDGSLPRHEMEIIEIGAVILNSVDFTIESEFQTFVRPVRHPELTDFCKNLTHIAQVDVDAGPTFREAIEALKSWMAIHPEALFCSWGDYDRNQFRQDCEHHRVEYPFGPDHLNLKAEYSKALGRKKRSGVADALRQVGLEFEGTHHRGLDDARNIARIIRGVCLGQ